METLEYHPIADIFPLLTGDAFTRLVESISTHGLEVPIILHADGRILDGRNRYRACLEAGVEPRLVTWNGDGSLVGRVCALNLERRHLTSDQRACCASLALPLYKAEAAERLKAGQLSGGRGNKKNSTEKVRESLQGEAVELAARDFGTNEKYVRETTKLLGEDTEAFEAVKSGEKRLTQVLREKKHEDIGSKVAAIPEGKFRVIYADPPWRYNDTKSGLDKNWGAAEGQYPTMSIEELCSMPIEDHAADNAVLFLWVTSPFLLQCAPIIDAWGFNYKTSFVWDKVGHNFGHYNSARHELLLICTRGSCTPDAPEQIDSVQSIEKRRHSAKPEEFRRIIDRLYPAGPRLELFARKRVDGWELRTALTN